MDGALWARLVCIALKPFSRLHSASAAGVAASEPPLATSRITWWCSTSARYATQLGRSASWLQPASRRKHILVYAASFYEEP